MAGGMLGSLPPGLRGMLAAEQMGQQRSGNQLQQLGGILSLQNMMQQQRAAQQQQQELSSLIPQLTDPAAQMLARSGDIKGAIARQFPQEEAFTLGPGQQRFRGAQPVANVPDRPTMQNLPVAGRPGVTQPTWLRPGEATGVAAGGPAMPEILNPEVQAAKQRIAQAGKANVTTNILPPQKTFENEDKLRSDYTSNPLVKSANEMQNAFNLIDAAYQRPSAANDLAMATKYMKILDPTSVVRESEFALAVNATGLLDKVQNYAAAVMEGKKLNPNQRKDFYESAKAINDSFQKQRGEVDSQYSEMAQGYGLNPQNVIPSLRKRRASDTGEFKVLGRE